MTGLQLRKHLRRLQRDQGFAEGTCTHLPGHSDHYSAIDTTPHRSYFKIRATTASRFSSVNPSFSLANVPSAAKSAPVPPFSEVARESFPRPCMKSPRRHLLSACHGLFVRGHTRDIPRPFTGGFFQRCQNLIHGDLKGRHKHVLIRRFGGVSKDTNDSSSDPLSGGSGESDISRIPDLCLTVGNIIAKEARSEAAAPPLT